MIALYECDICGELHPWEWGGDCRDDANRYADDRDFVLRNPDVANVKIRSMCDRLAADIGLPECPWCDPKDNS